MGAVPAAVPHIALTRLAIDHHAASQAVAERARRSSLACSWALSLRRTSELGKAAVPEAPVGPANSFKQSENARPGRYRHYPESDASLRPGISLPEDAVGYIPMIVIEAEG